MNSRVTYIKVTGQEVQLFLVRAYSAFKNGTKVLKLRPGTLAGLKKPLKPQVF
jgi:hypothetical protein